MRKFKLKGPYKSRLALLAIVLLRSERGNTLRVDSDKLRFDMTSYMTDAESRILSPSMSACGTSCCFLGFAPLAFDKIPEQFVIGFWRADVLKFVVGCDNQAELYEFLFSPDWSSSVRSAGNRALTLLEDGLCLKDWSVINARDSRDLEIKNLSKKQLITRLEKFLTKTTCRSSSRISK